MNGILLILIFVAFKYHKQIAKFLKSVQQESGNNGNSPNSDILNKLSSSVAKSISRTKSGRDESEYNVYEPPTDMNTDFGDNADNVYKPHANMHPDYQENRDNIYELDFNNATPNQQSHPSLKMSNKKTSRKRKYQDASWVKEYDTWIKQD